MEEDNVTNNTNQSKNDRRLNYPKILHSDRIRSAKKILSTFKKARNKSRRSR